MPADLKGNGKNFKFRFAAFGFGPRRQLPLMRLRRISGVYRALRAELIPGCARSELRPGAAENRARGAQLGLRRFLAFFAAFR